MYTKKVGTELFIVAIVVAICGLVLTTGVVSAADIFVGPGETYTTIQSAVTAANPFDTIIVRDGIYTENVNVSKSLTIRSENGSASSIVQAANSSRSVFKISVDSVNISGFTVTAGGGKAGIYLNGVDHCNISHNNVSNNHHGIRLDSANNNTISSNNASYNTNQGLRIEGSSYNTVKDNTMLSNNNHGIWMESSNNNNLTNNNASSSATYNGILMRNCSYNTLENNIANANNQHGINLDNSNFNNLTNNTANSNGVAGIAVRSSTRNTLVNNSASNNEIGYAIPPIHPINKSYFDNSVDASNLVNGKPFYYYFNQSDQLIEGLDAGHIAIPFCTNFTIRNVTVTNADGIFMRGATNSTVTDCISVNNTFGMMIDSSEGNNITNNDLSNNFVGIEIGKSHWNTIANNTVNANNASGTNFNDIRSLMDGTGIIMDESDHNQLFNNTASSNNGFGIVLRTYSQNNTILDNNASSNGDTGIMLDYSSYNNLTNNTASTNGQHGIWLRRSPYNTLRDNTMDHNGLINLILKECPDLEWWDNDIDTTNTVNGLPVYYIYNQSDLIIDNYATKKLSVVGCTNVTVRNVYFSDGDPITIVFTNNSLVENCTVTDNNAGGFLLVWSHYNKLANNSALNNEKVGFFLQADSNHNNITNNIITGNGWGIQLHPPTSDNLIYNNYFDNLNNAYDEGINIWNISQPTPGPNIIGGSLLGGNYWSDYTGTDTNGDGLGDTLLPYNSSDDIQNGGDWLPLVKSEPSIFDTGAGTYPSISGTFTGTITPSFNLTVSKLYTYPCSGTGGHTEYVKIWQGMETIVEESWNGYTGDWPYITFSSPVTLVGRETYNYTIITGSYPQIIHEREFNATGGTITCTEFTDANGRQSIDWIPAIRLE